MTDKDVTFTDDKSVSHKDFFQVNKLKIKTINYTEKNEGDIINYNDYITTSPSFKMPPPKPPK